VCPRNGSTFLQVGFGFVRLAEAEQDFENMEQLAEDRLCVCISTGCLRAWRLLSVILLGFSHGLIGASAAW
jgi:hypothetical protein